MCAYVRLHNLLFCIHASYTVIHFDKVFLSYGTKRLPGKSSDHIETQKEIKTACTHFPNVQPYVVICIHVYMYTYIHTYIYIHIYLVIYLREREKERKREREREQTESILYDSLTLGAEHLACKAQGVAVRLQG